MSNDEEFKPSFVVQRIGPIALVNMNRPPVNALDLASYGQLAALFEEISDDSTLNVAIVRSELHVFCAGADLKEVAKATPELDEQRQFAARRMFEAIRTCRVPVIAAIHGAALGAGAVIAACADIRIAADDATIGLPEINVGRAGGGRHLMRLMPQGRFRQMYFTGEPLSAEEANSCGLVEEVVEGGSEHLERRAMELARVIAAKDSMGLRLAKEALNLCEQLPVEEGYQLEQQFTLRLGLLRQAGE